jgi:formylglycine-generating enzyme required for sulfatase activity
MTTAGPFVASLGLAALCLGPIPHAHAQSGNTAFPVDLLYVKGGKVTLGSSSKELLDLTKAFYPRAPGPRLKLLRNLLSELGEKQVVIDDFYLHKYLVTNEQYLLFVQATGHRFPFHWWKFGQREDWQKRRPEYYAAFKDQDFPDLLYWEQYWDREKLPYAIPKGEEKHPVVFVSWKDAQAFAGWAGMRLPSEAEWLYAATGGKRQQYPWGDSWSEDMLEKLQIKQSRDQHLKPVGTVAAARAGEFEDMVAGVWVWTSDIGFFPATGEAAFKKEFAKLKKEAIAAELQEPDWSGAKRILKGGSFLSWQDPAQMRVGTRAGLGPSQTTEGVGIRVAKSLVPARDMCQSRLAVEYDTSILGSNRDPNLEDQIGVERYDLTPDRRLVTNYHAIAMAPTNHMGLDKNASLDKIKDDSREQPLAIGVLITTEAIANPPLEKGIYTVYYREKGMPRELVAALKEAPAAIERERKAADKKKEEKSSDEGGGEKKQGPDWRSVLSKYGITEEEAVGPDAGSIDFVRLKQGNLKVSTAENQLIFRRNSGDFTCAVAASHGPAVSSSYKGAELKLGTKDNKETLVFTWGSPFADKMKGKHLVLTMTLQMAAAPDLSKPWRTAADRTSLKGPETPAPERSNNNFVAPTNGGGGGAPPKLR